MIGEADDIRERFAAQLEGKTEEEIEALALVSPAVHFACYLQIKDKNNRWIQPVPNVLQLRMSEAYETLKEMGVKVRIIVVKPRRAGCSSFAGHIGYHHGMRTPIEGITISDIKDHSAELMAKLKDYQKFDSFPWGHRRIQTASHSLEWDNGTKWTVDTAENPDAGVGGTRQFFHGSEVSKWPQTKTKNDKKTMAAVLPSLSGSDTVVIAESTPEGASGWHYGTWCEAVTLDEFIRMHEAGICPENQWVKIFAAWFEFDDNRRATPCSPAEIAHLQDTLDHEEQDGIERYGWDWEQIAWRREIIASDCNGDAKVFAYYFPSDERSCWLASGSPRFDMGVLMDMQAAARQAIPETGYLVKQDNGKVSFSPRPDGKGEILIWEQPRVGMRYVVVCDPATGESQTVGADPDRTSIKVWRARYYDKVLDRAFPAKLVARLRGPFYGDDDISGGHIERLSRYYGGAICGLEVNQGLQVLRVLKDAGVPIYKRVVESHRTKSKEEQYGFKLTDDNQRRMVIEGLAAAIRNREVEILDPHTIHELMVFVTKPNGRSEAASGEHDDDVMADAMAWEVMPSASEYTEHRASNVDPVDRGPGGWRSVSAVKRGW